MSEVRDIQILALGNIEDPDGEAYYRKICRWYSKEFSTPLETVMYDIPERDVLLHYYENLYYELYHDESEEGQMRYFALREAILRTEKDVVEEEIQAEEDDEWALEMVEQIRREEEAARAKKAQKTPAKTDTSPTKPNLKDETVNLTVKGE
jgi:hypothetical protein